MTISQDLRIRLVKKVASGVSGVRIRRDDDVSR